MGKDPGSTGSMAAVRLVLFSVLAACVLLFAIPPFASAGLIGIEKVNDTYMHSWNNGTIEPNVWFQLPSNMQFANALDRFSWAVNYYGIAVNQSGTWNFVGMDTLPSTYAYYSDNSSYWWLLNVKNDTYLTRTVDVRINNTQLLNDDYLFSQTIVNFSASFVSLYDIYSLWKVGNIDIQNDSQIDRVIVRTATLVEIYALNNTADIYVPEVTFIAIEGASLNIQINTSATEKFDLLIRRNLSNINSDLYLLKKIGKTITQGTLYTTSYQWMDAGCSITCPDNCAASASIDKNSYSVFQREADRVGCSWSDSGAGCGAGGCTIMSTCSMLWEDDTQGSYATVPSWDEDLDCNGAGCSTDNPTKSTVYYNSPVGKIEDSHNVRCTLHTLNSNAKPFTIMSWCDNLTYWPGNFTLDCANRTSYLTGPLNILNGSLNLFQVHLQMNLSKNATVGINVSAGGGLNITASNVTTNYTTQPNAAFGYLKQGNGSLWVENSNITNLGWVLSTSTNTITNGFSLYWENATVLNNTFHNGFVSVFLHMSNNTRIINNTFTSNRYAGGSSGGGAIHAQGTANNNLATNVTIKGNGMSSGAMAMYLAFMSWSYIQNNSIENYTGGSFGTVKMSTVNNLTVTDNRLQNISNIGFDILTSSNFYFARNWLNITGNSTVSTYGGIRMNYLTGSTYSGFSSEQNNITSKYLHAAYFGSRIDTITSVSDSFSSYANVPYNGATRYDLFCILGCTAINASFSGDSFTKTNTSGSNLADIRWYLDVYVNNEDAEPVSGAKVTIANNSNLVILSEESTAANGKSSRLNLTEFKKSSSASIVENHNNYTVNVSLAGYVNKTYNLNLTSSLTVNFTFNKLDLAANASDISFNDTAPQEGKNITISATIYNNGDQDAQGVVVQFFKQSSISEANQIGSNITTTINASSNVVVNASWNTSIGDYDITVLIDPPIITGPFNESDEFNNFATKALTISSWETVYGNISGVLAILDSSNNTVIAWNESDLSGANVYVTDYDSYIQFSNLSVLGMNLSNQTRWYEDFTNADLLLGMQDESDNLYNTYLSNYLPIAIHNFTAFDRILYNASVVNSTNSTNFLTGILWDNSDDNARAGYFDPADREDIVFIANINQSKPGKFGVQDYEIRFPAKLRDFKGPTRGTIKMYIEIK